MDEQSQNRGKRRATHAPKPKDAATCNIHHVDDVLFEALTAIIHRRDSMTLLLVLLLQVLELVLVVAAGPEVIVAFDMTILKN